MIDAAALSSHWDPKVGDTLAEVKRGPISRGMLALFAGASNDHAFLHIDSDYVKAAGMPDVFAHGMLVMAYMGYLLTSLVRQEDIRSYAVRFVAITPVHATVRCSGEVKNIVTADGERQALLDIVARIDTGQTVLTGTARVAIRASDPRHDVGG